MTIFADGDHSLTTPATLIVAETPEQIQPHDVPTPAIEARPRDLSTDALRGIAIWGVVYVHGAFLFRPAGSGLLMSADAVRWAVPVFVILAGLFSAPAGSGNSHGTKSATTVLIGRLSRLATPFTVWSLVYFLHQRGWERWPDVVKIITTHFAGYGWSGQYYFIILFQIAGIAWLLGRRVVKPMHAYLAFGAVFILTTMLSRVTGAGTLKKLFDDRFVLFWIPHLLFGMAIAYERGRRLPKVWPPLIASAVLFLSIAAFVEGNTLLSSLGAVAWATYQNPIWIATTPILFIAFSSLITAMPDRIKLPISGIGQYSLGIFCLNPLVIDLLSSMHWSIAQKSRWISDLLLPIASVTAIMLICYALSRLIGALGLTKLVR
ncbi:MAG: acyltransferase [Tepidisphaeraceae bacterium]